MPAALFYHPEGYTVRGPKLMGRNAAGASFLRGFLASQHTDRFWILVQKPEHARHFIATARAAGRTEPVVVVNKNSLGALSQAGTVFFPGPGIGEYAWQRAAFGHNAWSLCGITHTTASSGAMDALAELLTAPIHPWDAVICTSTAVKENVRRILQAQADYLVDRLGARKLVLPLLPVIPLGVHTADFAFTGEQKNAARQAIAADARDIVVLFMGRLSFHGKAHPLAMYQALEAAAKTLPRDRRVILVECGWHANAAIAAAFADAAGLACPSVRVVTLDGRNPQSCRTAWACADICCSLSDNIQETFGLVPVEAMAAGLPVVVSDWDGYKDTVRDQTDGFRIPTVMPETGLGGDLAVRHALGIDTYDMYCGHACSFVSVDIRAATQAFIRLFASPQLRERMGAAGRQRAKTTYDWAVVMRQYEALWERQTALRQAATGTKLPHPWPARMDPFYAFGDYPTAHLTAETKLQLTDPDVAVGGNRLQSYANLAMVSFAEAVLPSQEECLSVLQRLADGPKPAAALAMEFPAARRAIVFRGLAWLLKLGIVMRVE